ncbi:MAG: hypothetical protein ACUVWX_09690 [Kiritimatiellia bacterium]
MDCSGTPSSEGHLRRRALADVAIFITLVALFVAVGLRRKGFVSSEAVVVEGICAQLLRNTTAGRQALIGSIWWPPLPVLLRLPLVPLFRDSGLPVTSVLVSAFFGAGLLCLIARAMRDWGFGCLRYATIVALAVSPDYLEICANGSSATQLLFLMTLAALGLVQWIAMHKLRALIRLAFSAAALILTSFESGLWLVVLFVALGFRELASRSEPGRRSAIMVLALLPVVYVLTLWFLMNWLIMNDSLYFLRSILRSGTLRYLDAGDPIPLLRHASAWPILSAVCLIWGGLKKDCSTVYLALLALAPLALALFLLVRGFTWNLSVFMFSTVSLAILTLVCIGRPTASAAHSWLTPVVVMLPLVLVAPQYGERLASSRGGGREQYADLVARRAEVLPRLHGHVLARSPYARVFVAGYESFALLGTDAPEIFVPSLDFDFIRARKDYHGQDLFLLVHSPRGRSAMDSIHWKYPEIYSFGSETTLFDSDWDEWRLFEIVQAPAYRGR